MHHFLIIDFPQIYPFIPTTNKSAIVLELNSACAIVCAIMFNLSSLCAKPKSQTFCAFGKVILC